MTGWQGSCNDGVSSKATAGKQQEANKMAQVKVTDQFTGEFTICEVQDLAATMTVYGMTAEEVQTWKDAQAALLDNDWYALPVMSEILQADIEAL